MKNSEIRQLSEKELLEQIEEEKSVLTKLKLNHAISPLDNPIKIRDTKKNIARLLSEKNSRKKQQKLNN